VNSFSGYENIAMIEPGDDERGVLKARFDEIAESFKLLLKYDASTVSPLVSVFDVPCVLREDISQKLLSREELLSGALDSHDGYFKVPSTLE